MEIISEINEEDVGINQSTNSKLIKREAARAVLFNDKGEIALL
ncbi:ADP-ribose pyrophosphatase, partial [Candidatus Woesearchaeota archaeon]|nr:ADP-ribose pyrophosphatase [Candidatus Woesearchaeota archaeon]